MVVVLLVVLLLVVLLLVVLLLALIVSEVRHCTRQRSHATTGSSHRVPRLLRR